MSVKVGVRVRPYNQRELDLNCRLCVEMIGNMTRLYEADNPDKHRDFTFDYSFWSHDGFVVNENGYNEAADEKYADQQTVFEKVGLQILANAWQGYHCCLFAYGQTGSGKSYSMVGYGTNKGIVPISCEQIFNRIENNTNKDKEYEVNVSMLQIYNQKVQDLLIPINKRTKEGFKIREHKNLGVYVQGLSKHYVDTYQAIEKKMEEGGRNRSIAATQMNASSSRAHTIISIEFRQTDIMAGKKRQKLSVIHLVDLAGSEKVGKTGATGDRLKQAAGINKSLSVLGLVISCLADKAMGKGKETVVPYRNSCLTRILQNALGGNSKTLMICAISPATDNYDQTLSTLRYADQAKKIQNKAVINESETDKIIRNLTAEKQQLREKLLKLEEMYQKLNLSPQMLSELNDAKQQIRYNNEMLHDYSLSKKQKLQQEEQLSPVEKVDRSRPHISNLNQDPQLSKRVHYSIDIEKTTIGKRGVDPPNDIEIGGMGIRQVHAIIQKDQEGFMHLIPVCDDKETNVYINGDQIQEKTKLTNLDRVAFGTNNIFIILIPDSEPRDDLVEDAINWELAQEELYLKKQSAEKEIIEEKEKKLKEETEAILRQKEEELKILQKNLEQSQLKMKNIEAQNQIKKAQNEQKMRTQKALLQKQIQNSKMKIKDSETLQKQKIKEKYYFQKKLLKTLPKCIQLNLIAREFKRHVTISVKMSLETDAEDGELDMKMKTIKIKVVNSEVGYSYWWDTNTLSNRYYIIKDMSEQYFETGIIPQLQEKDDPFWDPPQPTLIGRGFLTTKALTYMFDNPIELPIIGEDDHCGTLNVNLIPTDETGTHNLCEEMDEQAEFEPEQLLGKPFYFNLEIKQATIPPNYRNIFVEYALKVNAIKTEIFKTAQIQEKTTNPKFEYIKLHSFQKITDFMLNYLTNSKLIFKIFGCEQVEKKEIEKKQIEQKQIEVEKKKKQDNKPKKKSQQVKSELNQDKKEEKKTLPKDKIVPPAKNGSNIQMPKKGAKGKDPDCIIF